MEETGIMSIEGEMVVEDAILTDIEARDAATVPAPGFPRHVAQAEEPQLSADILESAGYLCANPAARENFDNILISPGYRFTSTGKYVSIFQLSDVLSVVPGDVVPEGTFLIPANYLVPQAEREKLLQGLAKPRVAPKAPDPLKKAK